MGKGYNNRDQQVNSMGQQFNKIQKRNRRKAYLKRKNAAAKAKKKT